MKVEIDILANEVRPSDSRELVKVVAKFKIVSDNGSEVIRGNEFRSVVAFKGAFNNFEVKFFIIIGVKVIFKVNIGVRRVISDSGIDFLVHRVEDRGDMLGIREVHKRFFVIGLRFIIRGSVRCLVLRVVEIRS